MGNEATVRYQIAVTRTGEGATQAVNDFKAVSAAATQSAAAINTTTPAVNNANAATAAAGKQFQVFRGALTLVAGQAFPQLTASVMVAKNAVDAMRASNTQLTLGLATVGAGVVGLTSMILSAAAAWGAYRAEKQQAAAQSNLDWQEADIQKRLIAQINQLEAENELTKSEARSLRRRTGDSSGNQAVGEFIQRRNEPNAQQVLADLQRQHDLMESIRAVENNRGTTQEQIARMQALYSTQLAEINRMEKEGLVTKKEANDLADVAATKQNNQMASLRSNLTEIQDLQNRIGQQFASGLSHAMIDFANKTKSAKEAFADFARSFLSSVAQMIMEMLILKALQSFGFMAAGGGTFPSVAARGGMFPQMMAAGGVAGVSSVSSATYFPKFNVVAGEAGSEMLTVLARPRMMEIGGMQAVVGNAGSNRLAITNADELAQKGGGAGGMVDIRVTLGPELRAEIVNTSVQGARVQVAQDMREDSPISRGVKSLTG